MGGYNWDPYINHSIDGIEVIVSIGGHPSSGNYGFAQQFELTSAVDIFAVNFDAYLFNRDPQHPNSVDFSFKIYGGNAPIPYGSGNTAPIPNPTNVLFSSNLISLDFDLIDPPTGGSIIYNDEQDYFGLSKDINLTLEPGTYWLSTEGEPHGSSGRISERLKGAVVTPEPSTIFLLGVGLFFMIWRSMSLKTRFLNS